jgi:hypothetical protein
VTLFLVATASAKMFLYIRSYGLTRLRVITEVFMLWLALTTVFVCVWLFRPKMGYMKPAVLTFLALFAALMWLDVDTQVARYNVRAYQMGSLETVDVSHLAQLSDGAVPYLYELTADSDPEIAQMAQDVLRLRTESGDTIRSWNYTSGKARQILDRFRVEDIGRKLDLDLSGCQATVIKNTRYTKTQPLEYAVAVKLTEHHGVAALGQAVDLVKKSHLCEHLVNALIGKVICFYEFCALYHSHFLKFSVKFLFGFPASAYDIICANVFPIRH